MGTSANCTFSEAKSKITRASSQTPHEKSYAHAQLDMKKGDTLLVPFCDAATHSLLENVFLQVAQ